MRRGFTLIELLVVISIMGVIIGLSLVALQNTKASARDAQRKANLEDIRSALEIYRADCGSYPSSAPSWGSTWSASCGGATNTYMSLVPQDPLNSAQSYTYQYYYDSTSKGYTLCSYQEQGSGGSACAGQAALKCGTEISCRYSVQNP